ncbi:MAG: hypothetical protein ACXWWD_03015 [Chitinophagaceae bacterium]
MVLRLHFFILVFACSISSICIGADTSSLKILFIGNSLTYTNNLPALVQEIGRHDSVNIRFTSLSFPNYSFEDHWNEGQIQKEIEDGKYDFVVAQQGPSAMPDSRVLLIEYSKRISELCKNSKTRFCLYTVWPAKARSFDHDGVIVSYKKAAEQTSAVFAPAGLAWKEAWKINPDLQLYGPDNFHPSTAGSLLAAMTIYAAIKEKKSFYFLKPENVSWKNEIIATQLETFKLAVLKILRPSF